MSKEEIQFETHLLEKLLTFGFFNMESGFMQSRLKTNRGPGLIFQKGAPSVIS